MYVYEYVKKEKKILTMAVILVQINSESLENNISMFLILFIYLILIGCWYLKVTTSHTKSTK